MMKKSHRYARTSSRKVKKVGYLFIAPSEIDITKIKRWQWRFFVLYDDGELTYSLDDNPLTLPQGKIRIDKCQDVLDATTITGHPNSLKLEFNDNTNIFIAGSGLDEIMKWKESLVTLIESINDSKKFSQRFVKKSQHEKICTIEKKDTLESKILTSSNETSKEIDLIDADLDDEEEDYDENYDDLDDDLVDDYDEEEEEEDDDNNHLYNTSGTALSKPNSKKHDKRRHSYKEDDKLRKQRLKDNLNQLLIEYKQEEEQQMRKSSFSAGMPHGEMSNKPVLNIHRGSLDNGKPSYRAFNTLSSTMLKPNRNSLAVTSPSKQSISTIDLTKQNYINSAFKPINKTQDTSANGASTSTIKANDQQTNSTSSYSSSSCSSWSSTSSSNSPPKLRVINNNCSTTTTPPNVNTASKSPTTKACLTSPPSINTAQQKNVDQQSNSLLLSPSYASTASSTNSNKSLTIKLRNNSTDENVTQSNENSVFDMTSHSIKVTDEVFDNSNTANYDIIRNGYLWKLRENRKNWDKYWFSLNQSTLNYFLDKNLDTDKSSLKSIGKIDLFKCTQVKDLIDYEQYSFQVTSHTNGINTILRTTSFELRNTWIQAIKQTIEHSAISCLKCKPKLIVNPMQLNNSTITSINSTPATPPAKLLTTVNSGINKERKTSPILTSSPIKHDNVDSVSSRSYSIFNKSPSQVRNQIENSTIETRQRQQQQHVRFKMDEQRHSGDYSYENLIEKMNTLKEAHDITLQQVNSLTEQLNKQKETINNKDREISRLKSQTSSSEHSSPNLPHHHQQQQNEGWNKEVRNLDARISDVLGKIKEREIFLNNYDDWERKCKEYEKKYETAYGDLNKTKDQLLSMNLKLSDYKNENDELKGKLKKFEQQQQSDKQQQQMTRKLSLHDFDDDLGKVLMSKEEVITQLERSVQEKEKSIHELQQNLNIELNQTQKQQEFIQQLKYENEQLLKFKSENEKLKLDNKEIDDKYQESKNEIDYLQEEIKTLEFKFAHSQKEIQDYKSLIDTFDMKLLNNRNTDELKEKCEQLESELNKLRLENNDLNAHIYAVDEFMRDKDQQCEQLEEKNNNLLNDLNKFKLSLNLNNDKFCENLQTKLNSNELCVGDFIAFLRSLSVYLKKNFNNNLKLNEFYLNDDRIMDSFSQQNVNDNTTQTNILENLKLSLNNLNKFYSNDLLNINKQLLTYMSEQLMHKAILNGQLKFVCDTLRKQMSLTNNGGENSSSIIKIKRSSFNGASMDSNEQNIEDICRDENICKIASELLLYDEDSLRKLSGQLLNEAEHLNQLNCVISSIKKLRHKQFSAINMQLRNDLDQFEQNIGNIDDDKNECELNNNENFDTYINQVMSAVSDIYTQHKTEVCEQLNEMHKLMSITSPDDLFTHLQNENEHLKNELTNLRSMNQSNKIGHLIKGNLFKTSLLAQDDTMC